MLIFILYLALWQPKFWVVQIANAGASIFDIETTQHCLKAQTCREANPLMPTNRLGSYGLEFGVAGAEGIFSWIEYKHHSKLWWLVPTIGITAHTSTGVATELRFK